MQYHKIYLYIVEDVFAHIKYNNLNTCKVEVSLNNIFELHYNKITKIFSFP